ncbi:hypothetical protein B4U79_15765 [Dinothrombium tinctorium]|uniref:Uncharacterized protein n=1 Tax=Dinothrombium tinctorium TaxID=1965070 RepID=A0A3S3PL96_9ACAR|nr:hypothetical protein B4U79_06794 [Dinothrombium tinctorium]RWS15432.1 hypothetical protein B4U79_11959 [Dinothrombium tinctorium]RWS15438.1 hypothetical protein B4U79_11536 [Dinothrombium tinctorium]RWS17394.1 hypothetical protein B4U79_15765 [Dinothrombium tinctorium]
MVREIIGRQRRRSFARHASTVSINRAGGRCRTMFGNDIRLEKSFYVLL